MRIHRRTVKTAVLIAMASTMLAQDKSQREDPGGWNAAKWGMTEVELLAAFDGKAIRKDVVFASEVEGKLIWNAPVSRVEIETWRIGATDYSVQFTPDDSGKLRTVTISPHKIKDSGGREFSPPIFDPLNTLLVEKYGKPDSQTSSVQGELQLRVHVWVLPTTVIELRSSGHTRFAFNFVTLTYKRKDKAALDAL